MRARRGRGAERHSLHRLVALNQSRAALLISAHPPSVEAVIPPQEFVWDRTKLYPKQEAAIFERKRISVIEASTKSGKTDPACSMVGGVTSARSA